MTFELTELFLAGCIYLALLFGIAYASEKQLLGRNLGNHPLVYILSLGVYAGAWAFFGAVDLAYHYGWGFLAYYLGTASLFLFAPLVLIPMLRISRLYQLNSLADLLTFRYRSQSAGAIVTITMLIAVMPLLALQIKAVSDTVFMLSGGDLSGETSGARPQILAFGFCIMITIFTVLFGARHASAQERHTGLVTAIAFESLVKLFSLSALGLAAVYGVFGGFTELDQWLNTRPDLLNSLRRPLDEGATRTLLLIFFAAALALPHMFHMVFAEHPSRQAMRPASWGVPLLLMLLSMPILPILWAGISLDLTGPSQYYSLSLGEVLNQPWLSIVAFIGGLSAASGTIIVITLALASMCLNHLVLPFYQPRLDQDIYRWLRWVRRALIFTIIATGFGFFQLLHRHNNLSGLGFAAFAACLQFMPGLTAVLYWPTANRKGLIAGLIAGYVLWFFTLLLPVLNNEPLPYLAPFMELLGADARSYWTIAALFSLAINMVMFGVVSLLTTTTQEERTAAELCSQDDLNRPVRLALSIRSPQEMEQNLAAALGPTTAKNEISRALGDLKFTANESRPYALRRLRDRVEANLSGLLGPSVAHELINRHVPYITSQASLANEDINLIENRLEKYQNHLTGLARELDSLRRYHRQILQQLPVGICSLGQDQEWVMWNKSMESLTGISQQEILGSRLDGLPEPWRDLMVNFAYASEEQWHRQKVMVDGQPRWFSLHKTQLHDPASRHDGQIILLEDVTETQLLEQELIHSERLASIGRLAAGVAHEIGNPVTGIACLAQNMRYDTEEPIIHETAEEILTQTERIKAIVQSLVNFSHTGQHHEDPEPIAFCLFDIAQEAIKLLLLNKNRVQVNFVNAIPASHMVWGDPQRILQVFINLLSNARDASPNDSDITLASEISADQVVVTVTDQGSGIDKNHLNQIFEPFFTTKEPGEGTGLGLSLVYNIIEDHQGSISVESPADVERGIGTRFTLVLPRASEEALLSQAP